MTTLTVSENPVIALSMVLLSRAEKPVAAVVMIELLAL
jgi:hypothetical protein